MDDATVTLAPGEYWLVGDGTNTTFLDFSGSNSNFDLRGAQIKMDTRDMAGYGNSNSLHIIDVSGSNNFIQGLDFSGHDIDLDTDPDARRYSDRSAVYLQVTGNDNQLLDTTLVVRGSNPYGYGDVFGKGARFPESGQPVEEGGFAYLSHNKTSSFLVTGGAQNTVVDNLGLTSHAYGHGFFVQGGATNTTIRNSTITGELCQGNDAIAHPEYQEYAAGADGILGTSDDGGTRSGTPLPANIQVSCQEDGIRMYSGTTGLTVENTVVTNFRSGVSSTFADGTITIDGVEAYGTENAYVVGSNTTITNSKADIVNGPAIYVQYNGKTNTTIDIEIVGDKPVGQDWAVAYLNGDNFDVTIRSDLPEGFLPEDSLVRFGQTWFNNWRDQLRPTAPEEGDPGPFTNSTFTNLTNEYAVLGNLATGNTGYSQGGVVTNGKDNAYDGISVVLPGTRVVLTDTSGLGNNGIDANGDFDAAIFETNASFVFDGATLELEPGIRISQEKLTITGDGIDGQGALYTDGTVGTDTRFGSASGNENSEIFLDGDASIGVGVAGNQLNIGRLSGQGDFTKRGPGLLTVGKSSTFDGNFNVSEGQVSARTNVIRNNLTVAAGASISANGDFAYNTDGTAIIDGELDLNARANPDQLEHRIGSLSGSGSVFLSNTGSGADATLEISGESTDGVFAGLIEGEVSLVKSGGNNQALAGILTYLGSTTVIGGGLYINGTHTGGDDYSVGNGGTLGGNGDIGSNVNVSSGGQLAPGTSAGTLTVDDVTLSSGAVFDVEIGGTTFGSLYDRLITDSAVLGGMLRVSLLDAGGEPFIPSPADTFTILSSGTNVSGQFENVTSGDRVETVDGEGSFLVTYVGNAVLLSDFEPTQLDFGDAPAVFAGAGYPTLLVDDGARHAEAGPQLGSSRDVESDGAPSTGANGDGSDEDGVFFGGIGVNNSVAAVNIELTGASEGRVDAWIDFNRDGVWSPSEKIIDNALVDDPMQTLNYDLPAGLTTGDNYARVRISSVGGLSPNGFAADGEVEDYLVSISEPPTVDSIVINGGDSQRSSVDSVEVTFDQVVDINDDGGDAFSFVHESGDVVTAVPVITHTAGKTKVNFTFDPGGLRVTSFGSLEDGDYELIIDASRVTHAGVELDGDRNGTSGDDYAMSAVDGLFRKYGDQSGDDAVGLTDFAAFRQTFGKSQGESGYLDGLDSNGDNEIGLTDFAAFRSSFGT